MIYIYASESCDYLKCCNLYATDAVSMSRLQPGPMQGILRRLLEGLIQATSGQQLSRAYLYGALLYYLQLTSEQNGDQFTGNHSYIP